MRRKEVFDLNRHDILKIIRNRKQYEAEIMIIRDCSDELNASEPSTCACRYALLQRRINLIEHWLYLLPGEERIVVEQHLIEGWHWTRITAQLEREYDNKIPCDPRTLQRTQSRAGDRLAKFMKTAFAASLDFLIDTETKDLGDEE